MAEATRMFFDLQKANEIAQNFSGCLEPEEIARRLTDGLIDKFDCAFARVWLVEPDKTHLRLVASSGMYTNINGSFARVPMGCYKVGKIAQNRVAFLSNNLPEESWVKDRDWALANKIIGFAGYPLMLKDRVIGVLATFSHHTMAPEFLEVLQTLCTIVTVVLDTALHYQKEKQQWQTITSTPAFHNLLLSDQLVSIVKSTRLTLVGTEKPLTFPLVNLLLHAAETLHNHSPAYYRLIYTEDSVVLEAILPLANSTASVESFLEDISFAVTYLGGVVEKQNSDLQEAIQIVVKIPYSHQQTTQKQSVRYSSDHAFSLTERELEVMKLMTKGMRDRDIAHHLIISESTVKFHLNNTLKKLNAKTRSQALHQVIIRGLI